MKQILTLLFPFKLQLTILQLEEYKLPRFLVWIIKHPLTRSLATKKDLVITPKTKLILALSCLWFLALSPLAFPLTSIILLTNPFLLYALSILSLKPYEAFNKKRTIQKYRAFIDSLHHTQIIAITGSYGKTSTKEFLYQLLKTKYHVLRTPASYNTIFGLAKVIDYELDKTYDFFICELGAYVPGEIAELCQMVNPDFGLTTGIDKQHLERFKNLDNITKTKFELADYLKNKNMIFNTQNEFIAQELKKRNISYHPSLTLTHPKLSAHGLSFHLHYKSQTHFVTTPILGLHHLTNLALAIEMALKLGTPPQNILQTLKNLHPSPKRFELKKIQSTSLVDNTYNSNPASFLATINSARAVRGKKALITPGLAELGKEEKTIHRDLAQATGNTFDQIILVGRNPRTQAFSSSINHQSSAIKYIPDTREAYNQAIQELINQKFDWVFLENDLTQNY